MTVYQSNIKKNKNITRYIISFVIIIACIAGAAKLYALTFVDSYVSPITTAKIVYAHTVCRLVINKNPGNYSMMIPTKYSNEWSVGTQSFISHPPAGVTVLPCTNVGYSWGRNVDGQIGNATTSSPKANPTVTFETNEWKQLIVGGKQECGINIDNNLYCWGSDWSGKLGIGGLGTKTEPTLVSGGHSWKYIGTTHGNQICAITTTNQGYCWGANRNASTGIVDGRLGNGDTLALTKDIPTLVSGGHAWKGISTGAAHSCGITTTGVGYCWGINNFGQNGDNTEIIRHVPTLISGGYTWKEISTGAYFTCGITTANQAYCWGLRLDGRIGDGILDGPNRRVPSLVSGGYAWKQISSGVQHTCAVRTNGQGFCWGSAVGGRLGNGVTTGAYATPQLIQGNHSWKAIYAGDKQTCGITTNDKLYCWGDATDGVLGNGVTTGLYSTPVLIKGEYSWKDISTGTFNTAGIQKNHRTDRTSAAGTIITASSSDIGQDISKAFDDHDTTEWVSNGVLPHTIKVDFGPASSNVITEYTLYRSALDFGLVFDDFYSPAAWKFQGSSNGSTWVDLDIQSGQVILNDASPIVYSFSNTVAYRHYRLYITAGNGGGNLINISEIEMSESDL